MSKKKIYGIGYNDIDDVCNLYYLEYTIWKNLLKRAYSQKYHKLHPTYIGVTVEKEWLVLSSFITWLRSNYIHGYSLDKDLLIQGNKHYSPDTCRYIPQYVNTVLIDSGASRGSHPIGVCMTGKKYIARCRQLQASGKSKKVHLGYFETSKKAHAAWQRGKIKAIEIVIEKYKTEPMPLREIIAALKLRIRKLKNDIRGKRITVKL
ncbi:hypothetical protein M2354_000776 [Leclercia adecarboxylata]|uniref:hypothetical protein n=1 Tax=Leclercia adecarboxylata TaxID=83655 RepID=UPI0024761A55|nr:hypothetical protein [Leclercia adecarboxylata]MDH6161121.1 hypothetical protein [Leclercia adecarboxylata]